MSTPTSPRGPRLTLMVNSAQLSRVNARLDSARTPASALPTPSSTIVEYGDELELDASAAERAEQVFNLWSSKAEEFPHHRDAEDNNDVDVLVTPIEVTPVTRKARVGLNAKFVNERIGRFFQTMNQAAGDTNKELAQENRGLHQRIAALQRIEQHLLKDNQDLTASLKQVEGTYQRQLEDELKRKNAASQARIRELEEQLAQQNERIYELTLRDTTIGSRMTDADVATWFNTGAQGWSAWVDEFSHHNPNRLLELHPLQQQEVKQDILNFIRLTEDGKLPAPLLSTSEQSSINTTRLILNGILSDFIVSETLVSPFWIFAALSNQGFDLESPTTTRQNSDSPVGFRMDWTVLDDAAMVPPSTSPFVLPPVPNTARSITMMSPRHPPSIISPLQSLTLSTRGLSLQYNLPAKSQMEDLLTLLSKTQKDEKKAPGWRAQLLRMLSEGGLGRDVSHPSLTDNEDKQMLANARREYARRLKDKFLGSAARFFLHDQDALGISKLEGLLINEIDLALRFSVDLWSRDAQTYFIGLKELSAPNEHFQLRNRALQFHDAQWQTDDEVVYEDAPVVMVVQPAIGSLKKIGGQGDVFVKAQVLVAPRPIESIVPDVTITASTTPTPPSKSNTPIPPVVDTLKPSTFGA